MLRPFWRYYGGKWMAAPRYPAPSHRTIVEPFAGAAGYSLRYPDRRVILVEKYPVIAEIWRYLIGASSLEVLAIPTVDHVDDLPGWVPEGARLLVGMTMNIGSISPNRRTGNWILKRRATGSRFCEGWTAEMRYRVASQVGRIRHWRIIEGDYSLAPTVDATWFVDAPYEIAGKHYVHGSTKINFPALADWCRSRLGQVIVCEAKGATWLPFRSFGSTDGVSSKRSSEVVWTSDNEAA